MTEESWNPPTGPPADLIGPILQFQVETIYGVSVRMMLVKARGYAAMADLYAGGWSSFEAAVQQVADELVEANPAGTQHAAADPFGPQAVWEMESLA